MLTVYIKLSFILHSYDRKEHKGGLDWMENPAHLLQLCNIQNDVPSVVKEGTVFPFGTAQNALTDLCLALKSD